MVEKAGFIGMGDIGLPMAKRIVAKYPTTIVGHRRREPIEEMKGLGATEASTAREAGEASDAVIVMVQNDKQAEEVIYGPDGLIEGMKEGSGILLMGTFRPGFCQRVYHDAKARGIDVIDAPVVGGRMGAEKGTLGISAGGDETAIEKFREILELMGKITYCGAIGSGQIFKLANNMCAVVNSRMAYEAIAWGVRCGASEEDLVKYMANGSGSSYILQNWEWMNSIVSMDPPPPTYYVGAKDLHYALEIAMEMMQPCPITALVKELQISGPPKLPRIEK